MRQEFDITFYTNTTCDGCQCRDCNNAECPVPCTANAPCDFNVTKCPEYKDA